MTELLSVNKLSYNYDSKEVLRNVSFSLNVGDICCVLGSNGVGKSTLFDLISGVKVSKKGEILYKNRDVLSIKSRKKAKEISYLIQSSKGNFSFMVKDFVLMGLSPLWSFMGSPSKEDYKKVENVLSVLGISNLINRDYKTLSGGESRLVLIARTLIRDSSLLILDEPAASLDYRNEFFLLNKIRDLVELKECSVIFSSHSPNHPLILENLGVKVKVLLLYKGESLLFGNAKEVLSTENIKKVFSIKTFKIDKYIKGFGEYSSLLPLRMENEK